MSKKIIMECSGCGHRPESKQEGSWEFYKNKPCPKCGGEVRPIIIHVKKRKGG